MSIEEFVENGGEVASPIEQDASVPELNVTQLSLPDSFDESLCLDMYMEFEGQGRREKSGDIATKARAQGDCKDEMLETMSHHNDLELKVRELLSANLELKEKGRLYDLAKRCSNENEAEIEKLRSQMQHQLSLRDSSIAREKELRHEVLEYKRKAHLIGIDLEHARKESELLLRRAEKAEKECNASASALKSNQQKYETDLSRLAAERDEAKSHGQREIARIREESDREVSSSRSRQDEAFARESKLLHDARDRAVARAESLRRELDELRAAGEAREAEGADVVKELERQLADARGDLKAKSFEQNALRACQARTSAEADRWKEECDEAKDALARLQKEHGELERQSGRLEEAVRQKDEELKVYRHDDLLVDCDVGGPDPNGRVSFSPGRSSLVKNSVALARKCRELQSQLKGQGDELARERERNASLAKKEQSSQRLFRELSAQNSKNASAYIVSAVRGRDDEISRMSSEISALRAELGRTARERNELSSELSRTLERRERLDEAKGFVERMRHAGIGIGGVSLRSGVPHDRCADNGENVGNVDEDDVSEHVMHHRTRANKI